MNTYQLSIVIPHFNSSKLLEKLLFTIPKIKYIQIIVVDDKSKIIEFNYVKQLYKKYNFELYINTTDKKGAGVARNIGLKAAKGKWILFADSDDYFVENFYDKIKNYFECSDEVVFFNATSIFIDTKQTAERHKNIEIILNEFNQEKTLKNELFLRYKLPGPICKMIRKSFLNDNNIFFDEIRIAEDVMFSTKVGFYMNKFDIFKDIIYVITRNEGSLTTKMNEQVFDSKLKAKIEYYSFLKNKLEEKEFDILDLYFAGWLFTSLSYGIQKFFRTYLLLKNENIKIFNKRFYSISFIVKKLIHRYKIYKNNKRYYIED